MTPAEWAVTGIALLTLLFGNGVIARLILNRKAEVDAKLAHLDECMDAVRESISANHDELKVSLTELRLRLADEYITAAEIDARWVRMETFHAENQRLMTTQAESLAVLVSQMGDVRRTLERSSIFHQGRE